MDDDDSSNHDDAEPPWVEEEELENAHSLKASQARMEQQVYQIWTSVQLVTIPNS